MPSATTLKLKTNVPLTGFVRYANYWKGKPWTDPTTGMSKMLPDQVQLKGSWDGTQEESLFLPVSLVGAMLEMSLLRQDAGVDERGNPKYTVLNGTRKVRVLKGEDGKKKPLSIGWADAPAATAASTPAATPAAKASPPEKTQPVPDAVKLAKVAKAHRKRLAAIAETYSCAWRAAWAQIDELLREKSIEKTKLPTHVYMDLIARLGAQIGIEAHRENLVVAHREPKTPAPAPGVAAQAGALSGAAALQPIADDPYDEDARPDLLDDPFPEATDALENDELPF